MLEILILILFFLFFGVGFFLIYKQVALVKKGEFNFKDRMQCLIYGFLFSAGIMVVVSMGFIFTDNSLNPLILILPLFVCLLYISVYPLIDFLFIALSKDSEEGMTPFHSFLSNHFINISNNQYISALMAIILYLVMILPPFLLTMLGLTFSMIWISWMIFYPLLILTYYGSKGYIAGISNQYYHIPEIKRSLFLNFEDQKRGMTQFFSEPGPFIVFGMMIFVFVWAWISLIQTVAFFFTRSLAISTMSSYFVYVTLFFGIIGYFTRFWGRKIKYRGIDIYFAAYLMAAIGINVLVNFLLVNINVLSPVFNSWAFTKTIVSDYFDFSWAAVIEECTLITFTSYFLISKKNEFRHNIKYSKITECGKTFDPIPLFTLIKNKDPTISKHAEETMRLMFERIPLKYKGKLNDWRFKNSLMDGICDYNPNSRRICYGILVQLERDVPDILLGWIIEAFKSPNYDKKIPFLKSLSSSDSVLIKNIPLKIIQNLFQDPEWRVRLAGIKLVKKQIQLKPELMSRLDDSFFQLADDPSSQIQLEFLRFLSESQIKISQELILQKIKSPKNSVRATAIECLGKLDLGQIEDKLILDLVPLLIDSTTSIKSSILQLISRIGNFDKFRVSLSFLFDALNDNDEDLRNSAVKAIAKYYSENPKKLDIDLIINKIDFDNTDNIRSIVSLLDYLWDADPEKILTTFLILVKIDNFELKSQISELLVNHSLKFPNLILKNLLEVKDDSGFVSKGIITKTIVEITKKNPKEIIPLIYQNLKSEDVDILLNVLVSLETLMNQFDFDLELNAIIEILRREDLPKLKTKASQIISKIASQNPNKVKPVIDELFRFTREFESSSKITLMKSFLEISRQAPEIIPINQVIDSLADEEVLVREISTQILGNVAFKAPLRAKDAILENSLVDKDWAVRDAAIKSMGKIINLIDEKEEIIKILIPYIEDRSAWVRRSIMNLLSEMKNLDVTQIPIEKVIANLSNNDPKVRQGVANLLRVYIDDIEKLFDYALILLGDDDREVRVNMIDSIVKVIQKVGLKDFISRLLQNLSDEAPIRIQQSVSLILERTARYEDEKLKKRVLSLLKIRCEVSQDPIICEVFNKLNEK